MKGFFSLLYHSGDAGETSPFDKAIVRVVRGASIRLAAPFIGLRYLERIIDLAHDWRLISDVEAWLRATPARARWETWDFIRENIDYIRHVRSLHAKVVVSNHGGYVGSANLTPAGILGKTELGVFIESEDHCKELAEWFDQLWSEALPPAISEASELIRLAEVAAASASRAPMFRLSSASRAVRASLAQEGERLLARSETREDSLTETVVRAAIDDYEAFKTVTDLVRAFMERTLAGVRALTLREIVAMVKARHPEATVREVHDAVVLGCANHYSTAFLGESQDLAIIEERGILRECTTERLDAVARPFDAVLSTILKALSFSGIRRLPKEEDLAEQSGLPVAKIDFLIAALVDIGLLIEHDAAGAVIEYRLDPLFDWPVRFNRYRHATSLWKLHADERKVSLVKTAALSSDRDESAAPKGRYELRYGRLVKRTPDLTDAVGLPTERRPNQAAPVDASPSSNWPEPADWHRDMALARAIELLASKSDPILVEELAPKMARAGEFSLEDAVDVLAVAIQNGMLSPIETVNTVAVQCNWAYRPIAAYKRYSGTMIAWGMFAEQGKRSESKTS